MAAPTTQTFETTMDYVHPEILVNTGWLVSHLHDPTVRIVDVRLPRYYVAGHIPGAVLANAPGVDYGSMNIMDARAFENLMGSLGIGDDTTVVIYDDDGGLLATTLWWALQYYGHKDAKILNGGLGAWVDGDYPLETETPTVAPAVFHAKIDPNWLATTEEVKKAIDDSQVVILDAQPRPGYAGDILDSVDRCCLHGRPGHIATALSLPAGDTVEPASNTVLHASDLSRMFARLGLDREKRVITYDHAGFWAAHTAFVLYLMGFERVSVYDGSLLEWASDPSNPMEVEP
jgi:thiosulfate/3-mercaptopyruvate sulfurtransferase